MINQKNNLKITEVFSQNTETYFETERQLCRRYPQFFGWKSVQSTPSNSYPSAFAVELTSICTPKALQFLSFTLGQEEYDTDRLMSSDEMGLIEKLAA